jgi:hypothetical protein
VDFLNTEAYDLSAQTDFGTQLLSAILGAAAAILLRELVVWIRRPVLQISLDLSALRTFAIIGEVDVEGFGKYVRLRVHNNGLRAARGCEAKIEPMDDQGTSLFDPSILHWVRRYAAIYGRPQDQFAPIVINRRDHEFLDVIQIQRWQKPNSLLVSTYSHRPYIFKPNKSYKLKITLFSENSEPKSVTICFLWDGTWDGFNEKCVRLCESSDS